MGGGVGRIKIHQRVEVFHFRHEDVLCRCIYGCHCLKFLQHLWAFNWWQLANAVTILKAQHGLQRGCLVPSPEFSKHIHPFTYVGCLDTCIEY